MSVEQINQVIPYLASKFTQDHFKRLQIHLDVYYETQLFSCDDLLLEYYKNISPKLISFDKVWVSDYHEFWEVIENFYPSKCLFSIIEFELELPED